MFKNYFKIAWRNLTKRKVFTAINILGLAIGFGSSILIYLFISHHLSFDKFHANSDNIYRIIISVYTTNVNVPDTSSRFTKPRGILTTSSIISDAGTT